MDLAKGTYSLVHVLGSARLAPPGDSELHGQSPN